MYVKVTGEFFDPAYIVQNNALYSVCVGLNGKELQCSDQLFDELAIRLADKEGRQEISAAFCPKNSKDCLCNISSWVECCAPSQAVASDASKPSEKTLQIIQQLEYELRNDKAIIKVTRAPPWACR
jgi:hypothetical protein